MFYNKFGPKWYDEYWLRHSDGFKDYHKWVLNLISFIKPKSILDVGCGKGLLEKYIKTIAIDFSFVACKHVENSIQAYAEKLPFQDNNFDTVLCLEILEHTENAKIVFQECLRVTKDILIFTVPDMMALEQHHYTLNLQGWKSLFNLPNPVFIGLEQFGWIYDKCYNSFL